MRINNIKILSERFPLLRSQIERYAGRLDTSLLRVEPSRSGHDTLLAVKDGAVTYIHSKYDPLREAETLIGKYRQQIEDGDVHVIFYGIGLGYHVSVFCELYPNVAFSVFEPVPEMLECYLSNKDLSDLSVKSLKDLVLGDSEEETLRFLQHHLRKMAKRVVLIELPSHLRAFPKQYEKWSSLLKRTARDRRSSIRTNFAFQKRWTINAMLNFKAILETPNILQEKRGAFQGIPALLVAAGPSLDDEIKNLRYIKENGLAYIFSVGSAINALLHHGIKPDAACTYDPTPKNKVVFERVVEQGISDIPLIFGSTVGFETLRDYPGPMYHMITSQDTVSPFYLRPYDGEELSRVSDAPSIAVVTVQLLHQLGFSPIILVGQNLAYRADSEYASGIEYHSEKLGEAQLAKAVTVKDVYGNNVYTSESLNRMRLALEAVIRDATGIEVINTTKGGAHIEGTEFEELQQVVNRVLRQKVVQQDWLPSNKGLYDKHFLLQQAEAMQIAQQELRRLLRELRAILDKVDGLARNNNFQQAERTYTEVDASFERIKANAFFKSFVLPMNRLSHESLVDHLNGIRSERNQVRKAKRVLKAFERFLRVCEAELITVEPFFKALNEAVWEVTRELSLDTDGAAGQAL